MVAVVAPGGPSWGGLGPQRAARQRSARALSPTASASGGGSGRHPSLTPRGPADLAGKRPQEARRTAAAMAPAAPSEVGPERAAQRERA